MTLLGTAGVVLIGLVLIAGTLAPLLVFGWVAIEDRSAGWRLWVASSVVSFACLVAGVYLLGQSGGDEAAHCAAGTRYVEQNRVVGKTVTHEWACVPA